MSLFGSFEIGRRTLMAHQRVLDTIGHNLANAGTRGYVRQRAQLQPVIFGGGVEVARIIRVRDQFLDAMLLDRIGARGLAAGHDAVLRRLEGVVQDEPGTGLAAVLDQFFGSLQDLSVRPTDQSLRLVARDAGERVAATFHRLAAGVDQLKSDLGGEIRQKVADANALLEQIADLNGQIVRAAGQPAPNDLLDRRAQLLAELGAIVGVAASERPDGSLQVHAVGTGILLVDGTRAATLEATPDLAADTVTLTTSGTTIPAATGSLAALLVQRNDPDGTVKRAESDLDALARAVIEQVNLIHAQGAGLSAPASVTSAEAVSSAAVPLSAAGLTFPPGGGTVRLLVHDASGAVASDLTLTVTAGVTTLEDVRAAIDADPNLTATISGGRLTVTAGSGMTLAFAEDTAGLLAGLGINTFFGGTDARTIALDAAIAADPGRIATARPDADGLVHPGDGANALALAQLRTALVMSGGTETFTGAYAQIVARVGGAARDAASGVELEDTALLLAESLHAQTSGVSTDEELVNLTQSQHAYAAAARFVTTLDEVTRTLLGMAG